MLTPGKGSPVIPSVTVPVTVVCAEIIPEPASNKNNKKHSFLVNLSIMLLIRLNNLDS
jgi:hypothetical protein